MHADLKARLNALDPERRAALQRRLATRRTDAATAAEIPAPRPRRPSAGDALPLSFAQERLWFLDQLFPGLPAYHLVTWLRIGGTANLTVLQRAVDALVSRHEALRTTFHAERGRPVQTIHARMEVPVQRHPTPSIAAGASTAERIGAIQDALHPHILEPFDLETGPLLRIFVVAAGRAETVIAIAMHHIISDGWTLRLLEREITALYDAFRRGRPDPLAPAGLQYADYALWQREALAGPALQRLSDYWRTRLAGAPPLLELPFAARRPARLTSLGAVQTFRIPGPTARGLRELARGEGVTLFMTLLAAWKALLQRLSGRSDLVIGAPVANRGRVELEDIAGFFANIMVLRTDLSGNLSLREAIRRVRETVIGGLAHQEMPFERLVEDLQPDRSLRAHPLAQIMFSLEPPPSVSGAPPPETEVDGVDAEAAAEDGVSTTTVEGTSKFDLTLYMSDDARGMTAGLEYSTDLYDHAAITRLAGHIVIFFAAAVAQPDAPLSSLPILTSAERGRLLKHWNGPLDERAAPLFPDLIAHHARTRPDAPALVFGETVLSYAAFDAFANRLALYLAERGVRPGDTVGLCLERSVEVIVAMIAVWRAGAAYLPLDPSYPPERLAFMLEDAAPALVLAAPQTRAALKGWTGPTLLFDPATERAVSRQDPQTAPCRVSGEAVAYVIYTSGSTGRPKGVVVQHAALANTVRSMAEDFGAGPASRQLNFFSLSFDGALFEIGMILGAGGALHLAPGQEVLPGPGLIALLKARRITNMILPPSVLAALPAADLPDLVEIVGGAETCPVEVLRRWAPGRCFFNAYGPTETTIYSTATRVTDLDVKPPIGLPIRNTWGYVLDRDLNLLPVGVPGELYLGGTSVAYGYHNRPGMTAERFVPDPFAAEIEGEPGRRMYRTGDLARRLPDGRIAFLGRADRQVKLRGQRIELEEIERTLDALAEVHTASVVLGRDRKDEPCIIAYVVREPEDGPGGAGFVDGIRGELRRRLPAYMVPGHVVELDALPLTTIGKVDRRALELRTLQVPARAGGANGTNGQAAPAPDFTPVGAAVAAAWQDVLAVEQVAASDNFFDLGGHSLLAIQLVSRIAERLGVELPIHAVFEAPTLAEMAAAALVLGGSLDAGQPARAVIERQDDPGVEAGVAALSDDEVEAMLARMERDGAAADAPGRTGIA